MWILIAALLALGIIAGIAGLLRYRKLNKQLENGEISNLPEVKVLTDCGADSCEGDEHDENCNEHDGECTFGCLTTGTKMTADYYDDEELDELKDTDPAEYTEEQEELFRDIFYTMEPADVAGWVHSLQLRNVALPDGLKEEIWLVLREQREKK